MRLHRVVRASRRLANEQRGQAPEREGGFADADRGPAPLVGEDLAAANTPGAMLAAGLTPPGCVPQEPVRVLICEDQGLTALRLRQELQALGYEVVGTARDGEEAVVKAGASRPKVILMDVNMPRLDGLQATARIMRDCPTTIIMLTAYNEPDMVQRALEAGASGYLVKPIRREQLQPTITLARSRFGHLSQNRAHSQALERDIAGLVSLQERERWLAEAAQEQAAITVQLAHDLRLRLQEERQAAQLLAETFLCPVPTLSGYELASRYEPAFEAARVGGDYFDFLELGSGRTGIVIGDACGKGVPAAALTTKARYMLRAFAAEDPAPAWVLMRLNRALVADPSEAVPFLTLIYGILDRATGHWTYANGGHPGPVLFVSAQAQCTMLPTTGPLVGVLPTAEYTEVTQTLIPGSLLVFFTDGITEAGNGQEMLDVAGVCGLVQEHAGKDAAALSEAIFQRAQQFSRSSLKDDAAVVVLRRKPVGLSPPDLPSR